MLAIATAPPSGDTDATSPPGAPAMGPGAGMPGGPGGRMGMGPRACPVWQAGRRDGEGPVAPGMPGAPGPGAGTMPGAGGMASMAGPGGRMADGPAPGMPGHQVRAGHAAGHARMAGPGGRAWPTSGHAGEGMPGGRRHAGASGKAADFRNPVNAVNAFLDALKQRDADLLAESTALRAPTESHVNNRKLFTSILDHSLSDDDFDDLIEKLDGYQISFLNTAKSTGRQGVVLEKKVDNHTYRRTIEVRREKAGWKVVDVGGEARSLGLGLGCTQQATPEESLTPRPARVLETSQPDPPRPSPPHLRGRAGGGVRREASCVPHSGPSVISRIGPFHPSRRTFRSRFLPEPTRPRRGLIPAIASDASNA